MIRREADQASVWERVKQGVCGSGGVDRDSEGWMPLEFDEQHEDFYDRLVRKEDGDGDGLWHRWSEKGRLAMDEVE